MTKDGIKKSVFARSSQLLKTAANLARQEVSHKLAKTVSKTIENQANTLRIRQAQLIVESLGKLKGAAMKAGQMISLTASDFLPPEAVKVLSKLHANAPAIPFSDLREVVLGQLSQETFARLENINETAAASASIGQVHTAEIDGQKVAVKIQYPHVADAIDSDIAMFQKLVSGWLALSGRKFNLTEIFEELKVTLKYEADYLHELENLQKYQSYINTLPGYKVPKVYPEFSTSRVLTMEWIDATLIKTWLDQTEDKELKNHVCEKLVHLYYHEFFVWGFVQTDPNPGNFMVLAEDNYSIVLLDMGAAIEYSESFRLQYLDLIRTLNSRDSDKIIPKAIEFGLLDERESDNMKDLLVEMMDLVLHPFQPENQPFKFGDPELLNRALALAPKVYSNLKYSTPPKELIFLHRKLSGIFHLLRQVDAEVDLSKYWDEMISSKGLPKPIELRPFNDRQPTLPNQE